MMAINIPALLMTAFGALTVVAGLLEVRALLANAKIKRGSASTVKPKVELESMVVANEHLSDQAKELHEASTEELVAALNATVQALTSRHEYGSRAAVSALDLFTKEEHVDQLTDALAVERLRSRQALMSHLVEMRVRRMRAGLVTTKASASHTTPRIQLRKVGHSINEESSHQPA